MIQHERDAFSPQRPEAMLSRGDGGEEEEEERSVMEGM